MKNGVEEGSEGKGRERRRKREEQGERKEGRRKDERIRGAEHKIRLLKERKKIGRKGEVKREWIKR